MGDGLVKKYAVILNGDIEPRHQENVDRAIRALRREGNYDISVVSTVAPKTRADHYLVAEEKALQELVSGLKLRIDDDDLLVVYVTGHGQAEGDGCVGLPKKSCLPFSKLQQEIDQLSYGKRIVVMDNCFSGNGLRLFANPKTSVVTQGSPGETVSCQTFSPFFWSEGVSDQDGDGKISLQERYAFALEKGRTASLTQFFNPDPIGFSGSLDHRPFKTKDGKPVEVHDGAELEAQLSRLKPGQLALVDFGADWCVPCAAYKPVFEKISQETDGRYLMIRAQGIKGSEEDWGKYGIRKFPTVAFVDSNRKVTPVSQISDPLDSLLFAALHSPTDQLKLLTGRLDSPDKEERRRGLKGLEGLGKKAAPALAKVKALLADPDEQVRCSACTVLAELGGEAASAVPELERLLEKDTPAVRIAAIDALTGIGPAAKATVPTLLRAIRSPALGQAEAWEIQNGSSPDLARFNAIEWTFELSRKAAISFASIDPNNPDLQKKLLAIAQDEGLTTESRIAALLGLETFDAKSAELSATMADLQDRVRELRHRSHSEADENPSARPLSSKPKARPNLAGLGASFFAREGSIGGGADLWLGRQIEGGPGLRLRLGAYGAKDIAGSDRADLELRASISGAWFFGQEDAVIRPAILFPEFGIAHRVDAKETAFHGSPLGAAFQIRIGEPWRFEVAARPTMDYGQDLELGGESTVQFIRKF
jgi:thiol-disulfide isomerase/thioredoxin